MMVTRTRVHRPRDRSGVTERRATTDLVPLNQDYTGALLGQEVGTAHADHTATHDYDATFSHLDPFRASLVSWGLRGASYSYRGTVFATNPAGV